MKVHKIFFEHVLLVFNIFLITCYNVWGVNLMLLLWDYLIILNSLYFSLFSPIRQTRETFTESCPCLWKLNKSRLWHALYILMHFLASNERWTTEKIDEWQRRDTWRLRSLYFSKQLSLFTIFKDTRISGLPLRPNLSTFRCRNEKRLI
jgi:hypothetical protein